MLACVVIVDYTVQVEQLHTTTRVQLLHTLRHLSG